MSDGIHEYTLSEEQYDEVKDDENSMGHLLQHYKDSETHLRRKRKRSNRPWPIFLHVAAIILYGLTALLITYHTNKRHNTVQSLIYSPANEILQYSTRLYDLDLLGDPNYFGTPSPQIDKNWHELMAPSSIHLSESERQHYDPKSHVVEFPDGTYLGQLMVYHELHCLKRLYQYINSEHYFPNLTDREREMNKRHTEHCLGTLRQSVMCHGDVSVITFVWGKHSKVPLGEFSNPHQCVNFERLHKWALERAVVNGLEPGVLVHPKLGPSFPDGHGTKIGFSDEDIDEEGNFIKDGDQANDTR